MEVKECSRCGKLIMGNNENHANYLLMQHYLTHDRKQKEVKQNGRTNKSAWVDIRGERKDRS